MTAKHAACEWIEWRGGVLIKAPWAPDMIAWGPLPQIPESVKQRQREIAEQIADLNRQIFVEARRLAGHTQTQAGAAVHAAMRTVQQWESGERPVPKAVLELYLLRTSQHPEEEISKKRMQHAQ